MAEPSISLEEQRPEAESLVLRSYLEQACQAVAMLDPQLRLTTYNPLWAEIFQLEQDCRGRVIHEAVPNLPQEFTQMYQRGLAGDVQQIEEDLFVARDGQRLWLSWEVRPWLDGLLISCRNISEQVRSRQLLADSEHFLRMVLDMLPQSIFWKDVKGRFLGVNQRFYEATGVAGEVVGRTDYEMPWSRTQSDFFRDCDLQVISSRQPMLNIVEPINLPSGQTHWLSTSKIPLINQADQVTGVLGTFQDITHLKLAEEEAALRVQRTTEEIRNPVNTLARLCKLLEEQQGLDSVEVSKLKSSTEALLNLLQELDGSGHEHAPRRVPFSAEETLVAVFELLEPLARELGVPLLLDGPPLGLPSLYGDPARFRQLMLVFMRKALEQTPREVLLEVDWDTPGRLKLRLVGYELPLLEAELEELRCLEAEYRQDPRGLQLELPLAGSGPVTLTQPRFEVTPRVAIIGVDPSSAGLLARQLARWDVSCQVLDEVQPGPAEECTHLIAGLDHWLEPTSRRQLQSWQARSNLAVAPYEQRFQASFLRRHGVQALLLKPLSRPGLLLQALQGRPSQHVPNPAVASLPFSGKRVLVVNDTLEEQQLLGEWLVSVGCRVDTAVNGLEALERVAVQTYDLILMDCVMPELDGYAASTALRQQGRGSHLPIVGLTTRNLRVDQERCLAAGMDDCLSKPLQAGQLQLVLKRWLS